MGRWAEGCHGAFAIIGRSSIARFVDRSALLKLKKSKRQAQAPELCIVLLAANDKRFVRECEFLGEKSSLHVQVSCCYGKVILTP